MLNENVLITAIVCWAFKQVFFRWAEHLEHQNKWRNLSLKPGKVSLMEELEKTR